MITHSCILGILYRCECDLYLLIQFHLPVMSSSMFSPFQIPPILQDPVQHPFPPKSILTPLHLCSVFLKHFWYIHQWANQSCIFYMNILKHDLNLVSIFRFAGLSPELRWSISGRKALCFLVCLLLPQELHVVHCVSQTLIAVQSFLT